MVMSNRLLKLKRLNESGMVSIIVTMVLIIVMSLMVMAMTKNANREQRQSLDRQLSDQAFYNAMTGINDWDKYIKDNAITTGSKSNCDISSGQPAKQIDGNNSVSCVTYNTTPGNLQYSISPEKGATVKLSPSSGTVDKITFKVVTKDTGNTNPDCGFSDLAQLPTSVSCNVGAIEVNLISTASYKRDDLRNNNFVGYFFPRMPGATGSIGLASGKGAANQGTKQYMNCTSSGCIMNITGVGLTSAQPMYLHIKSLYKASSVSLTGYDSSGNIIPFSGAQLLIDSTGKAEDVLRRVQVRKPLNSQYVSTDMSIATVKDLCKLLKVEKKDKYVNGVYDSFDSIAIVNDTSSAGPAADCSID